jgi:hypothetical protein
VAIDWEHAGHYAPGEARAARRAEVRPYLLVRADEARGLLDVL